MCIYVKMLYILSFIITTREQSNISYQRHHDKLEEEQERYIIPTLTTPFLLQLQVQNDSLRNTTQTIITPPDNLLLLIKKKTLQTLSCINVSLPIQKKKWNVWQIY